MQNQCCTNLIRICILTRSPAGPYVLSSVKSNDVEDINSPVHEFCIKVMVWSEGLHQETRFSLLFNAEVRHQFPFWVVVLFTVLGIDWTEAGGKKEIILSPSLQPKSAVSLPLSLSSTPETTRDLQQPLRLFSKLWKHLFFQLRTQPPVLCMPWWFPILVLWYLRLPPRAKTDVGIASKCFIF